MSIELLDTNAWWGPWPFAEVRTDRTPAELAAWLKRHGIAGAWVSPLAGIWVDDPMPANRALREALPPRGKLWPLPILNPVLPNWLDDLRELAAMKGVTAVRLLPAYHGYRLTKGLAKDVGAAAAEAGIRLVITVRLVDERHEHHAVRIKPVAVADLQTWLREGGDMPLMQGLTRHEIDQLVASGMNQFLSDLSFAEWQDTMTTIARSLPLDRVMLGTLTPLHVTAAQVAKVTSSREAAKSVAAVAAGNARRFFGR